MAHVVALSSWVAFGHVGLSAAAPVLQAMGHRVTQLPTVLLSNHPGWPHAAGERTDPGKLSAMLDALERNGWLGGVDAVLTGYLPGPAHVDLAVALIARLRTAGAPRVVVDPVLGDAPKGLYIAPEAAAAIRDRLLPQADVITPNLFELAWLTGAPVETADAAAATARELCRRHGMAEVLVTSPPFGDGQTGVLAVSADVTSHYRTSRHAGAVPQGTGDVFAALIAGGVAAGAALGQLHALIGESLGAPHLRIAETAPLWTKAAAVAGETAAQTATP